MRGRVDLSSGPQMFQGAGTEGGKTMSLKILLIYPYPLYDRSKTHEDDILVPPIGVYYVAALLKENGFDVALLNWSGIHKTPDKVAETFQKEMPHIVAFSILNANRWGGVELARIAKQIHPKTTVVFGGVGASFLWKHLLTHFPVIDFVVTGEGERSFLDLARAIEAGQIEPGKDIPGVAYKKDGRICKTSEAPFVRNLDSLPIPAKHFTYQHVVSSRGCPGKCTFCGSPRFWARRVRFRSPDNFVEELELLYRKGVRFFYVSDDTFTLDKKRVVEICKKIIGRGLRITWYAISRADCVNEEVLYWMRKAGCIQVSYGIESGSQRIRTVLGKPLKTDHVKRAFFLTHRFGILARAYFIYGAPGETWKTIDETIALLKTIKPFAAIAYILEIYPGTKLYEDLLARNRQTDDIWLQRMEGICHFEVDPDLTQEDVLAFGQAIREALYGNLSAFVDALELVDDPEFFEMHADFCSRLAMTLSHGDYAHVEEITGRRQIAERLYRRALSYAPVERAYLGLGILKQRDGEIPEALEILSRGLRHFPHSEGLNVCLGTTYMSLGRFEEALECLHPFEQSPQALRHMASCYRALGNDRKEAIFRERAEALTRR